MRFYGIYYFFDGLVQYDRNYIAKAVELPTCAIIHRYHIPPCVRKNLLVLMLWLILILVGWWSLSSYMGRFVYESYVLKPAYLTLQMKYTNIDTHK